MLSNLILILYTLLIVDISYTQRNIKFFRKDYHYLEKIQGFYKWHTVYKTWEDAKKTCKLEGATLFYPVNEFETKAVIEYWNKTQSYNWVFIGISSRFAKGTFATLEGIPIKDVYDRWAPAQPNDAGGIQDCVVLSKSDSYLNDDNCDKKLPFICKKTLASLEWNDICDVPDNGYIHNETLEKCYKLHLYPRNWSEAHAVCYNEQSYLAVINSQNEADYFIKLMEEASKEKIPQRYSTDVIYLGFQNINGERWTTIHDTPLEETGYKRWSHQLLHKGKDHCGIMSKEGILNSILCDKKSIFICEREMVVKLDQRIGVV